VRQCRPRRILQQELRCAVNFRQVDTERRSKTYNLAGCFTIQNRYSHIPQHHIEWFGQQPPDQRLFLPLSTATALQIRTLDGSSARTRRHHVGNVHTILETTAISLLLLRKVETNAVLAEISSVIAPMPSFYKSLPASQRSMPKCECTTFFCSL
jgi:hypothetical protein